MTASGYDLAVIGGGSAAFAAAITASELGARVAMVEAGTLGGTCVNIGCIPSKALLASAQRAKRAELPGGEGAADLAAMVAEKDALVAEMRREKYEELVDVYGFEVVTGHARFIGPKQVEVDGRSLPADRFVVAVGAAPVPPPIPGLDRIDFLTSTSALQLDRVPGRVAVIGANAVGLELGQLFLDVGSDVTFVEALPRVAPFEEPEISSALAAHLRHLGAKVHTGAKVVGAGEAGGRRWIEFEVEDVRQRLEVDDLLVATGRRARTAGLGLDLAGVETDPRGHIRVNEIMATGNPAVYAAGDVATLPQYVYVAAQSGVVAAENALTGAGRRLDLTVVPRVTFTTPQVASVGLTEAEAQAGGWRVATSILPLDLVPRARVDRATTGLVKLVAEGATGLLLGAHVMADGAGDVIQAAVMAIKHRATVTEVADTFHPYLTMAEGLKLAAQGFDRDVAHLSCCA